jgi:uncharacterized protein with WD repeat
MGNGPRSWSKAKLRLKRPSTHEQKRSHDQQVGRLARLKPSRPAENIQKPISKKRTKALEGSEKRLRALNKLLREIEALQQREARGEALDEQQQAKLDRLDDVMSEMETLMGAG